MDKHNQIQQMDAIYLSAHLTLIATVDMDPQYGLPGVSDERKRSLRYERVGTAIVT
jgi:hypothetical protein